jgi:hypothetical protein
LITDKLSKLLLDDSIEEIELVCCDKEGPCLKTKDKVLDIKGYIDPKDNNRYSKITITFEHFTWTFHHRMPIRDIKEVGKNEYLLNYTNPWICGQFLIRLHKRGDADGTS